MAKSALVLFVAAAVAVVQIESGNRAYRRGEMERALEAYRRAAEKRPEDPAARYNLGTALLSVGEAAAAAPHLARGVEATSPELRARALYNLGNAHLERALAGDADAARRAIEAYRGALLLRPNDLDAKWNLELALRQMEAPKTQAASAPQERAEGDAPGSPPQASSQEGGSADGGGGVTPSPRDAPPAAAELRPLSRAAAEQILNAVEEQERALQREKLRRRQTAGRPAGPDW